MTLGPFSTSTLATTVARQPRVRPWATISTSYRPTWVTVELMTPSPSARSRHPGRNPVHRELGQGRRHGRIDEGGQPDGPFEMVVGRDPRLDRRGDDRHHEGHDGQRDHGEDERDPRLPSAPHQARPPGLPRSARVSRSVRRSSRKLAAPVRFWWASGLAKASSSISTDAAARSPASASRQPLGEGSGCRAATPGGALVRTSCPSNGGDGDPPTVLGHDHEGAVSPSQILPDHRHRLVEIAPDPLAWR